MSNIILPILSLLPFLSRNLDETFAVLHKGLHYNGTISTGYNTVKQALDDEALVLPYGNFCIDRIMKRQVGWQLPFQQSEDRIEIAVKMRKRHDCSKPQQHTPFLAESTQLVDHSCDLQQNQWRQHSQETGEMQVLQELYQRSG